MNGFTATVGDAAGETCYKHTLTDGREIIVAEHDNTGTWQWFLCAAGDGDPEGYRDGYATPQAATTGARQWAEKRRLW